MIPFKQFITEGLDFQDDEEAAAIRKKNNEWYRGTMYKMNKLKGLEGKDNPYHSWRKYSKKPD